MCDPRDLVADVQGPGDILLYHELGAFLEAVVGAYQEDDANSKYEDEEEVVH